VGKKKILATNLKLWVIHQEAQCKVRLVHEARSCRRVWILYQVSKKMFWTTGI